MACNSGINLIGFNIINLTLLPKHEYSSALTNAYIFTPFLCVLIRT